MLSLLSPGMRAGLKNVVGASRVEILVYTEEDYETAIALSGYEFSPLAVKVGKVIPAVQHALDLFVLRNDIDDSSVNRINLLSTHQIDFGTIGAIGDDYVLLEMHRDIKREPTAKLKQRRIVPKSAISLINLDANPIRFVNTADRLRIQRGGYNE